MLAKSVAHIPTEENCVFEPKWDGFRCIVFRDGDELELGSRSTKSLLRYFPELVKPLLETLPDKAVLDGELVIATPHGLDFDTLGQRIHPAVSRIERLSQETPASFVAFDLIALGSEDLRQTPFGERRERLAQLCASAPSPIHLTPATTDPEIAADWFTRFEGAGFDGVMAKPSDGAYVSDKRTIYKVKHKRTADMVVAGFRTHKDGAGVGSLLLGLFDDQGRLNNLGVASSFSVDRRAELAVELAPYAEQDVSRHPWAEWMIAEVHGGGAARMPGAPSRWNGSKDLNWTPLRCELVAEVSYEGMTNNRLRHPARFVRWRPDKDPLECGYDQLEQLAPTELTEVFGLSSRGLNE